MDETGRLNALKLALDNELKEREFYLKNAERTKNTVGKRMFQQIADEELEHHERLKQLYDNWKRQERWPETLPLKVKDSLVRDILQNLEEKVEEGPWKDADDLNAIRIAIDFEAKGASYYAKLRDEVEDQKEKEFFNLLANIEHEHYVSLKDTEEYLTDPASWYTKKERHGLDGA
ncbi:MAG: ferritin family protein [Candidatus Bathyarchaeia archaeon]